MAIRRRLFAAFYDTVSKGSEEAGLRGERRRLLASAEGATLEIGAGTGLNLEHYPEAVTRLVLAEPDEHMRRRLERRAGEAFPVAEIVDAGVAKWQDRVRPLYNLVGCNPNRETLAAIEASALGIETVRHGEVPKAPKVERPLIVGSASR